MKTIFSNLKMFLMFSATEFRLKPRQLILEYKKLSIYNALTILYYNTFKTVQEPYIYLYSLYTCINNDEIWSPLHSEQLS
jgi:hypothetical protein